MFAGTVSARIMMHEFWMMTMSGLAVVNIQDTGMVPSGLSHACSPGRSAYIMDSLR